MTQLSSAEAGGQTSPALRLHSKHVGMGKRYPIFNLQVSVWFVCECMSVTESSAAGRRWTGYLKGENEAAIVLGGWLGAFRSLGKAVSLPPIMLHTHLPLMGTFPIKSV